MKKSLILLGLLAQLAWVDEAPSKRYSLAKVSWNGNSHQVDGTTRVGGYLRNPNTEFDWETLIHADLSNVTGNVDSMVVRIHATGGQTGYNSSIQLFEQPISGWNPNTVNYNTFGSYEWSNLLANKSVPFNVSQGWIEFRGSNLDQLASNWVSGTTPNNGMILAGNFWYYGYYIEINDAEVLIYTSGNTQNTEVADFLSFEDFSNDWPNSGQIDQAIAGTSASHGSTNLHLNHFGSNLPNSGISSRYIDLPTLGADDQFLLVDVAVSDDASLTIKAKNTSFSTITIGNVAISNSNGSYQTIAYPLTQSIRDFLNSGDIQIELNVGNGDTYEIKVDNMRFSN